MWHGRWRSTSEIAGLLRIGCKRERRVDCEIDKFNFGEFAPPRDADSDATTTHSMAITHFSPP